MKTSTKRRIRNVVICVIFVAFLLVVADFIVAIYVFNLMKGDHPYSQEEIQMYIFDSYKEGFAQILEEVEGTDLSNMFKEGDTENVKRLFPFRDSADCFDREQRENISYQAKMARCDEIFVRGNTALLLIFYDENDKPITLAHVLSDSYSYDTFLELCRSQSTDGKVDVMEDGWVLYSGI